MPMLLRGYGVTLSVTLREYKHNNMRQFAATLVYTALDLFIVLQYAYQQRTTQGDDEAIVFVIFTR